MCAQALMDTEVMQHLGASRYERTLERTGERNGSRERRWDTQVGTINLQRTPGSVTAVTSPACLSRVAGRSGHWSRWCRKPVCEGVSTRRVDELVQALGLNGISKCQVSVLCAELDSGVLQPGTGR